MLSISTYEGAALNMNEAKRTLLLKLMAADFRAVELNLFLDTHPHDAQGLAEMQAASEEVARLKDDYEQAYGPLEGFGHGKSCGPVWQWLAEPWPWEMAF